MMERLILMTLSLIPEAEQCWLFPWWGLAMVPVPLELSLLIPEIYCCLLNKQSHWKSII